MGKWYWVLATPMMWPFLVPLCASFFDFPEGSLTGTSWVDPEIARKAEDDDLRLYVAMITAAHF